MAFIHSFMSTDKLWVAFSRDEWNWGGSKPRSKPWVFILLQRG